MKSIDAHAFPQEAHGHYPEPSWCSQRLFEQETFQGNIWEPCCGFGTIAASAKAAGYSVKATDIIDRGYQHFDGCLDFLASTESCDNIVCNPPFNIDGDRTYFRRFAEHALKLSRGKVAMVWATQRLNAATWLRHTPLVRIWYMTPRPSMPTGDYITAGKKPVGGKADFIWLVWEKGKPYSALPFWLHRDGREAL